MTNILVNNHKMLFKVDSGADVTVISDRQFQSLKGIKLVKTTKVLSGAGNSKLNVLGKFECLLGSKCVMCVSDIYVVKGLREALLGRPAIQSLEIIKEVNIFFF